MKNIMKQLCKKLNGWNFMEFTIDNKTTEYLFDFYLTDNAILTLHADDTMHIHLYSMVEYYTNDNIQKDISLLEFNKILEGEQNENL